MGMDARYCNLSAASTRLLKFARRNRLSMSGNEERDSTDNGAVGTTARSRRAILVVDVVESVRLMQDDESGFIGRWREFVAGVQSEFLLQNDGRLVKSLGDGLLLEFADESRALAVARAMQRRATALNAGRPPGERLALRAGLHTAEVVVDQLDIYGRGVNLAARLAGLAGPGQIVLSDEFRLAVEAWDPLDDLEDLGECFLKHLNAPVRAFRTCDVAAMRVAAASALEDRPAETMSATPSLAVLTFVPPSQAPDDCVVAELLSDAVVARLAVCPWLRVISRWSSRTLEPARASGAIVWSTLRAHFVVQGRIARIGSRLVGSVELVDTLDERVVWAGRQAFDGGDLLSNDDAASLELAAEIARQVVSAQLRHTRNSALPTLEGNRLQFTASRMMHEADPDAFERAHEMITHLIDRHPRLPSPRAWAAMWHVLRVTRGVEHEPERVAGRALDHVNRALDNDDECSLALAMGGFVHCHLRRDLDAADVALDRALALNPSEAWAWLFKSVVATFRGHADEGWTCASRASELSPLDPMRHYFDGLRASAAVAAQRWDDAERLARRSLGVNGTHLPTLRGLAIALVQLGRTDEAVAIGREVMRLDPSFTLRGYLASAPPDGLEARKRNIDALRRAGLP